MLLIFDCPTEDSTSYLKFSDDIIKNSTEVLILFQDTEIPNQFSKQVQHKISQKNSGNNLLAIDKSNGLPSNIISTYDINIAWLLIGIFGSQNNKQVHIFTDQADQFKSRLETSSNERKLKTNLFIRKCNEVKDFNVDEAINLWSQFDNQEVLSNFEVTQLKTILKKFIKQVVTSKQPNNLERLLNISQNLVKAHMSTIRKEKYKVQSDLSYHFIRSLFLDNVLDNQVITSAILTNQIQTITDFENFTQINYTPKFQQIIDQIQLQIHQKQQKAQQLIDDAINLENQEQQEKVRKLTNDEDMQVEQNEDQIIFLAVQTLFDQYLHLFQKARIFEIKKLHKLVKQIANYVHGFIMKKDTAPQNTKDKAQAQILHNNSKQISSNILKLIAKFGLIKMIDANIIEHDHAKVNEILQNQTSKTLKESDIILDKELANQIFDSPILVFKKEKEETKHDHEQVKKDPIDIIIEKLYQQMKSSKHFPNSLRELERLIKKHIVKKGESQQDEDKTVESVMKRMNDKGMFTQKTRTGESKEHAKDPKLRNVDIIELYKKEKKEDIPIVFESSLLAKPQ
ncbi:UNKNOWN [Stylonychia lemnae]|uniref:Uncharacterized protein n=1 Tax=Stylonychia lemnae TaxID=5949 RepID=A0A078AKV1_STYLE|nr:UNKNOWN [Stylonychia lemnae]|eukprot:CDW82516.1 UNKNOWN [Stylonychia lemnae]